MLWIGALGGSLFHWLHLPLAWMLGPLLANLIASQLGCAVGLHPKVRSFFLGILGLILGGQASQETLMQVSQWPASLGLLCLGVTVMIIVVASYFRWIAGMDRASSWFSAVPGAMTAMIMMGGQAGGDERQIALAHALRLTFVILLVPALLWAWMPAANLSHQPMLSQQPAQMEAMHLWLLLGVWPAWQLGQRLRFPTPELTGPLAWSLTWALLGFPFQSPWLLTSVTLLVLGASIGARFYGTPWQSMVWIAKHALAASLLGLTVAAISAWIMHWWLDVPLITAMLTMTPGGVGEMAMMALALGIDPVFVAAHHLFRILALMLLIPLLAPWWRTPAAQQK